MNKRTQDCEYLLSENTDKSVYKVIRSEDESWGSLKSTNPFKIKDKNGCISLSMDTTDNQPTVIKMDYEQFSALYELFYFYAVRNGFDNLFSSDTPSKSVTKYIEDNFYNPYPDEEFIGAPGSPDIQTVRINYILTR